MTLRFISPDQCDYQGESCNQQGDLRPSQGTSGHSLRGLRIHSNVNDFHVSPLSSRTADGGDQPSGSRDAGNAIQSARQNLIQFPRPTPSLEPAATSRASSREPFIHDADLESGAACIVAFVFSFFATAIGVGLYVGSLIFDFFD